MKHKINITIMALGLVLPAVSLNAQDADRPARGEGRPGRPGGHPLIRILDTDKDGVISKVELSAAAEAVKKLDVNGDNQITREDLADIRDERREARTEKTEDADAAKEAKPARPEGARRPVMPVLAALDVNDDKVIDTSEINSAPQSLAKLDANGDGQLTANELRPARGEGRPERPARGEGEGKRERRAPRE